MESTQHFSPDELALMARLERLLCQPAELHAYARELGKYENAPFGAGQPDDEFAELLWQLRNDNRRLRVLNATQLRELTRDPVALLLLAGEISSCEGASWDEPMAAAGRERLAVGGWAPPTWAAIQAAPAETTDQASDVSAIPHAPLGEVLDAAPEARGRALVFKRRWEVPVGELDWEQGTPAVGGDVQASGNVWFTLQANVARQDRKGQWVLQLGGALPRDEQGCIEVTVSGWGKPSRDVTFPVQLGPGKRIDIDVTGLLDPTPFFQTRSNSSGATIVVRCSGKYTWQCTQLVSGPALTDDVYAHWTQDKQGLEMCVGKAAALFRSVFHHCPHDHQVRDAVNMAAANVFRARYLDTHQEIGTPADFSRAILGQVCSRFHDEFSKQRAAGMNSVGVDPSPLIDMLPDHGASIGVARFETSDLHAKVMQMLTPRERDLLSRKYVDGLTWEEIALQDGASANNLCRRAHRTLQDLRRRLREQGHDIGR